MRRRSSKLLSIAFFVFFPLVLSASGSRDVFAKYPNAYFIETGTFGGDGVAMALAAGFKQIISIELSDQLYQLCCKRFAANKNVKIVQGDSSKMLGQVLKTINVPATIWLDGHYSGPGTAQGKTFSPILCELESIKSHCIKTHTLLIDDVRLFGTIEFDYVDREQIINAILAINPDYEISYENGFAANDILVAKVKGKKK